MLPSPLNHKNALKLSIVFSFLFVFLLFIAIIFNGGSGKIMDISMQSVYRSITSFVVNVFIFFLLFEFCFWVSRKNWKGRKKLFVGLFGTIAIAVLISPGISKILLLTLQKMPDDLHNLFIFTNLMKDLVAAVIVFLSTLTLATVIHNHQTLLENQKLVAENIRNRYEALKNQLNPHFLFNSLNTLDGLIGFDDEKAHSYLQNMSSSFRYAIQNKEITTLVEELQFVESYAYLMKIRYGDNLNIQYAVDEKYNFWYIMPISLQLLIENAIKHNIINDKHPLTIHIKTTEKDTLVVSNTIQPKINAETGEGVGLANLVERYNLLFGKEVMITRNGVFGVEIPLINYEL